ncbi:MAG TPA: hypothetical protein VLT57_13155 [Bryobacteraceae bacterium]|nr:hypothetical protein [Bryobacteraceae bacterium]
MKPYWGSILLFALGAVALSAQTPDDAQAQAGFLSSKDYDKAIELGEKGLAQDPDNLGFAYNNLKAAEGKKDAAAVKKWATESSRIARKIVQGAKDDEDGKHQADYARQVDTYTEYSLSATAMQSTTPADIISLFTALEQQNPKSQYLAQSAGVYLHALQQSGQAAQAGPAAERILGESPDSDDALLVAADYNLNQKRNAKTIEHATRLIDVLNAKQKPEAVSAEDWNKQKNTKLGLAYWYAGLAYSAENKFSEADKTLREALPLLEGNTQFLGIALFNLGLADYKLAKANGNKALLQDALKFSQQSAAIKGPLQTQAAANVKVIRAEVGTGARRK